MSRGRTKAEQERYEDMRRMRFAELKPLEEIADKWGVSRQRVHQILGNTSVVAKRRKFKTREYIENSCDKTNEELAEELGLSESAVVKYRNGRRHKLKEGSSTAVGAKWEEWVHKRLGEMGFRAKLMPHHHSFDILVEGKVRVDVKSSNVVSSPPSRSCKCSSSFRKFGVGKIMEDDCDAYVCVVADTKDVFIIPKNELRESGMNSTMLAFSWPPVYSRSKYSKYHENYEVLRKMI